MLLLQAQIGLLVNVDACSVNHYVEIVSMPSILRTKLLLNLEHALDRKAASTYLHPGPHYEGSYHAISCYFSLVGQGLRGGAVCSSAWVRGTRG